MHQRMAVIVFLLTKKAAVGYKFGVIFCLCFRAVLNAILYVSECNGNNYLAIS